MAFALRVLHFFACWVMLWVGHRLLGDATVLDGWRGIATAAVSAAMWALALHIYSAKPDRLI